MTENAKNITLFFVKMIFYAILDYITLNNKILTLSLLYDKLKSVNLSP